MEEIQLVAFVGMAGSGKSTCVDYLVQKGFPFVYFGGITIDEIRRRGLEVNETNEKTVREELRAKEGKGIYAQRIIEQIKNLYSKKHMKVVVDGLYAWTEYKIFKEEFGDKAVIIAVTAPKKVRHQRLKSRPDRPLTEEEANSRDYAEIENVDRQRRHTARANPKTRPSPSPTRIYLKIVAQHFFPKTRHGLGSNSWMFGVPDAPGTIHILRSKFLPGTFFELSGNSGIVHINPPKVTVHLIECHSFAARLLFLRLPYS
jgi:dephospho-CoA kinase